MQHGDSLKIVHVVEALGGGVLAVVSALVTGQMRAGHRVTLVASIERADLPPNWRSMMPPDLVFVSLPMRRDISPRHDLRAAAALRAILKAAEPDVVHLHSSKAGGIGRLAAIGLGFHTVYQPHGLAYLREDAGALRQWVYLAGEKVLGWFGATVVACSEGERDALLRAVPASKIRLVYNGISLAGLPERSSEQSAPLRIGTCSRICPQKNPRFLADVARRLRGRAQFIWIGDGDDRYKQELAESGVDVTGWRTRAESLKEIARLGIYIQTSRWEGMPISVMEAMAIGLPIVATDILGNRDLLLPDGAGLLVNDPPAMADALAHLIDDVESRRNLATKAARSVKARFSEEAMLRGHLAVYVNRKEPSTSADVAAPPLQ